MLRASCGHESVEHGQWDVNRINIPFYRCAKLFPVPPLLVRVREGKRRREKGGGESTRHYKFMQFCRRETLPPPILQRERERETRRLEDDSTAVTCGIVHDTYHDKTGKLAISRGNFLRTRIAATE